MDGNSSTGATKRFDGAGEDAARRYWKWRKWAKAYLTLLEAEGTPKEADIETSDKIGESLDNVFRL